jgi:hypothetical protein
MNMITRLLKIVTVAMGITNLTHAQTNLNFENWSGNEPNGWVSSNSITQPGGGAQTVLRETSNPGQGSSSVKMVTGSCPECPSFSVFGPFGPPTPMPNPFGGGVQLGSFENPGAPYTQRPISVDFKYKSKPMGNDAGGFQVELTRYNAVSEEDETIGEGFFETSTQVNDWTNMNIPIIYYSSLQPDKINIYATSSIGSIPDFSSLGLPKPPIPAPVAGSEFYLDDIVINLPSCEGFSISVSGTRESALGMGDGTATANPTGGSQPYSYSWSTLATTQSINSLIPGNYYVTVTDANGCQKVGRYFVAPGGCDISLSVSGTNSGSNNIYTGTGSATANASGGNPPYEYLWNTGANTATISNLPVGTYAVWVSEQNNPACGAWGYYTVWGPAGAPSGTGETAAEKNVRIYPNPTQGLFTIEHDSRKNVTYQIIDLTGKIILQGTLKGKLTPVDLAGYGNGVYILKIDGQARQFIKQN